MEHRVNQRVILTKRLLKEGLLRLLREKGLEQINVSELCRVAGINRATFYKHYAIPQDVLREIQQDVVKEIKEMAPRARTVETAKAYLSDICAYLYANRPLICILLKTNTDEELVAMFSEANRRYWGQYQQQRVSMDEDSVQLMVTFFSSGGYYLIRQWLLEDVKKTPDEVAELVFRFVTKI